MTPPSATCTGRSPNGQAPPPLTGQAAPQATGVADDLLVRHLRPGEAGSASMASGLLILVGMLLVALNLRMAVTSLGALLDEVSTGMRLSAVTAGLVTTLPAIAFAGFGALAPWLVRRFSPAQVLVTAMAALAAGQVLRVATDSGLVFVGTSALALAGIAVANVLLPMLVKQHFPHRTGLVTGLYTMTLITGAATGAAAAVPIAQASGTWRAGLGVWAVLAALAMLPWFLMARRTASPRLRVAAPSPSAVIRPGRTRLGWAMAIYFGTQSLSGYVLMGWLAQLFRDAGYPPHEAGLLLAGVTALGVPIALLMPALTTRLTTLRPLVLGLSVMSATAYLGLVVMPYEGALLWVALLAAGQGAFPMILAVIGLRARTARGTVALSAFAQSTGYVIAALGPFLVGLFYEATGGWLVPIGLLTAALAAQTLAGLAIARPRYVEDEIPVR